MDIQSFMKRKGFRNQSEFAKILGKSRSGIAGWNNGDRAPTYKMCQQLLLAGMTIQELFGDEVAEKCIVYADKNKENNVSKPSMSESDILAIIDRKMAEFKSHYKEGKI